MKKIELKEKEILSSVVSQPPGWLTRWGISIIFIVVVVFLFLSRLIEYPDEIKAPVILTTTNPPIRVFAQNSGKIDRLLVADTALVSQGEMLGVLENTASIDDVIKLEKFLNSLNTDEKIISLMKIKIPKNLNIGVLQKSYSDFEKDFKDLNLFLSKNRVYRHIRNLKGQIADIKKLNVSLENQVKIYREEIALEENGFNRQKELFKMGAISEVEFEKAKKLFLQHKRNLEVLRSDVYNKDITIKELKSQILELKQDKTITENSKYLAIIEDIQQMSAEIDSWKKQFLLIAPVAGKVVFSKPWNEQQFVKSGEEIMAIVPDTKQGKIIGRAILTSKGLGKIKKDMRVNIRLNSYPYREFGVLEGKVERISIVPKQNNYQLEINIPQEMETTYGIEISFQQEMSGFAFIITEKRSIMDRIFDKILNLRKN